MADTYEKNLTQKSTLTTSDYIRVVGSDNESYKQLVSDVAKKIIETYAGSSLAGSSQSVKSAIDSLNSKWGDKSSSLAVADLNTITESGLVLFGTSTANAPVASAYGAVFVMRSTSTNYMMQLAFSNAATEKLYWRKKYNGTWGTWKTVSFE